MEGTGIYMSLLLLISLLSIILFSTITCLFLTLHLPFNCMKRAKQIFNHHYVFLFVTCLYVKYSYILTLKTFR